MLRVYDENVAPMCWSRKVAILQALLSIAEHVGYKDLKSEQPGWTRMIMSKDKCLLSYDFVILTVDSGPSNLIDISRFEAPEDATGLLLVKFIEDRKFLDEILHSKILHDLGISKIIMCSVPDDADDVLYGKIWDTIDETYLPLLSEGESEGCKSYMRNICVGGGCHA